MCIFHNWTKWEVQSDRKINYTTIMGIKGILREVVQVRECTKCGLKKYKITDID